MDFSDEMSFTNTCYLNSNHDDFDMVFKEKKESIDFNIDYNDFFVHSSNEGNSSSECVKSFTTEDSSLHKEKVKVFEIYKSKRKSIKENLCQIKNKLNNQLLEKKTERTIEDKDHLFAKNDVKLTKKQIKMIKNRLSAQRSRNRKKREYEEMLEFGKAIFKENHDLKEKCRSKDRELRELKEKLCKKCSQYANKESAGSQQIAESRLTSLNFVPNAIKMGILTSFVVVFCLIGCLLNPSPANSSSQPRVLIEGQTNNDNAMNQSMNVPEVIRKEVASYETMKKLHPFEIYKDKQRKKERLKDLKLLDSKRNKFISRISSKTSKENNKFLNNNVDNANICRMNMNDLSWTVQKEINQNNSNNSIILKSNQNFEQASPNNREIMLYQDQKMDNINSLYCKDFVSTNQYFKIDDIMNKSSNNTDLSDECMFLHMLLPNKKPNQENAYFEIGCKVFEINKIYK